MSVYSQHVYGQPSYGSYSSAPPVPNAYQYYQQHPPVHPEAHHAQPTFHADPAAFRREFATRLSELTFNSRPLIQHLSMLAQEYTRLAEIVGQCIEAHIRRVPPWMKLPALYVLDAISKNVYEPYARQFSSFVVQLYLEAYGQVDETTRRKMEEMLLTWRTGSPTGKELFGPANQAAIERGIWGDGTSQSAGITKAQVLSELQFTLGQKERALQAAPYDLQAQNHIAVLHQLRRLVEAGVSQKELKQILSQLRALVNSTAPPPVPQPAFPPVPPAPQWQNPPLAYPHVSAPPPPSSYPRAPPPIASGSNIKTEELTALTATASVPTIPPANINNLLSTLLKAGVVTPSATSTPEVLTPPAKENTEALKEAASREYRDAILNQRVTLNTFDLAKARVSFVDFLYDRLGSQCKQCGVRFASGSIGKKELESHLDMHFRQNRKANQNAGRGHSRSWFIPLSDWVDDVSGSGKGKGRADGTRPLNPKTVAANDAKREADLRSQFVVVPAGEEAQFIACPICKEVLKSEFLEDEEEWVWRNAVRKDDKIYHATCHAEALVSKTTLAARLRHEQGHGSRSATPDGSGAKSRSPSPISTPSVTGLKRKAEENPSHDDSVIATPPTKKVALS